MYKRIRWIVIVIFWLGTGLEVGARTSEVELMKQYDETIFVISNFSGVDANLNEPRTIRDLLNENIGGFRFYLEWEKQHNQLMIKKVDGTSIPFRQSMLEIKNYLDQNIYPFFGFRHQRKRIE